MNEEEVGDEPLLMAEKLGDIPVIKGRDRYEAGMFALERVIDPSSVIDPYSVKDLLERESMHHKKETESHGKGAVPNRKGAVSPLFILDDGFQHWRLQRDKDVLLIDARNPFDRRKLLPVGLLREPIREIRRADIIVLTKGMGSDNQALMREIRRYNPRARVFVSDHIPSYVLTSAGDKKPLDWLSGKEVYAFCGIADPESFRASLGKVGAVLRGFKAYRDHYRYGKGDLRRMVSEAAKRGARWIITTEKDIMRLKSLGLPENLLALGIDVTVEDGFYEEVFEFGDKQFPEVLW
jgi:tetraacyldisaccharide 4'-kinase